MELRARFLGEFNWNTSPGSDNEGLPMIRIQIPDGTGDRGPRGPMVVTLTLPSGDSLHQQTSTIDLSTLVGMDLADQSKNGSGPARCERPRWGFRGAIPNCHSKRIHRDHRGHLRGTRPVWRDRRRSWRRREHRGRRGRWIQPPLPHGLNSALSRPIPDPRFRPPAPAPAPAGIMQRGFLSPVQVWVGPNRRIQHR